MRRRRTEPNTWLVTTDCCGRTKFNTEVRRGVSETQRGLVVCNDHFEPRHELNTYKPRVGPESRPTWPRTGDARIDWSGFDGDGVWAGSGSAPTSANSGPTYTPPNDLGKYNEDGTAK